MTRKLLWTTAFDTLILNRFECNLRADYIVNVSKYMEMTVYGNYIKLIREEYSLLEDNLWRQCVRTNERSDCMGMPTKDLSSFGIISQPFPSLEKQERSIAHTWLYSLVCVPSLKQWSILICYISQSTSIFIV